MALKCGSHPLKLLVFQVASEFHAQLSSFGMLRSDGSLGPAGNRSRQQLRGPNSNFYATSFFLSVSIEVDFPNGKYTRSWQLKHFLFLPLPGEMIQFD